MSFSMPVSGPFLTSFKPVPLEKPRVRVTIETQQ